MRISILKAAALGVALCAAPAFADSINTVETTVPSGTTGVTIGNTTGGDPTLVLTAILSSPQTVDGYTYTNYAMLGNDGTGSIDLFGKLPASFTGTPAVGDTLQVSGEYSPFDGIPELENMNNATYGAFNVTGTGATVAAPTVVTIPELNAATSTSYNLLEYVVQLNNVYFGVGTPAAWPTHANQNFNITDGINSVNGGGFFWASSYSIDGALGGTAIPNTSEVDMTGFLSVFGGEAQFSPISYTVVPEPASVGLLAMGALGLLRRRRKA